MGGGVAPLTRLNFAQLASGGVNVIAGDRSAVFGYEGSRLHRLHKDIAFQGLTKKTHPWLDERNSRLPLEAAMWCWATGGAR